MSTHRPVLFRLFVPFVAMIVLIVVICGSAVYWAGQETLRRQQLGNLERISQLIARDLRDGIEKLDDRQRGRIEELARLMETRVTLVGGDGAVLLDSAGDPSRMDNHNQRPEIAQARQRGSGQGVRTSDTIHESAIYLARLLDPARPDGMVVRVSYPRHTWTAFAAPLSGILIAAGACAGLVLIWLAMTLRRQWVRPVEELADAAEKMSAGEWNTRVEPRGADVLRFFSGRLNVVAAQAQKQLADLNHQRADLRSLVDSLPDPILLTDSHGNIALLNAPAARLLGVTTAQAVGRPLVSVVIEEPILKLLDDLDRQGSEETAQVHRREIRLHRAGQRLTYQAIAARARAGGVLLVLQNISALAATVQMKTDFVANASHELRTPIAAIKIAFETLREVYGDDPEQAAKCVEIIDGHVRRLEAMLADLLDLSRVESPDAQPVLSPLTVRDLFSGMRSAMSPMAEQKNVRLLFEGDEDFQFNSDIRLLQLVLKNLIENSIKFTPAGGNVTTSLHPNGQGIELRVADTGIGIAPEHIDRVFERFYQIDPARTGAAGRGTGLGLAIVKHAMNTLGGEVALQSTLGKGTTVTCRLPI